MNLLYLGKYPPLQGGTSSAAYWRLRTLKSYDIHATIITCGRQNEFVCPTFPIDAPSIFLKEPIPWHIPYTQLYAERLVSKSLELARNNSFDLIEGNYLFPYGFAAFITAKILGKPLLLRHAGSDLARLSRHPELFSLAQTMISGANVVATYAEMRPFFKQHKFDDRCLHDTLRYVPDPMIFLPQEKDGHAVFCGKITEKWNVAQIPIIIRNLLHDDRFNGVVDMYTSPVNSSTPSAQFIHEMQASGIDVTIHDFVPPDSMPEVLGHASYAIVSSIPDGILEQSNIVSEALLCGCKIIGSAACCENAAQIRSAYPAYIESQMLLYQSI